MQHYQSISQESAQQVLPFPIGKAVCVGRNYADHIAELNNTTPTEPLLFIKPSTAIVPIEAEIAIPKHSVCHNELEIALLVKEPITQAANWSDEKIQNSLWGVGLALDLTLRATQSELKEQGYPWERAKAFDNSCPVSSFVAMKQVVDLQRLEFTLSVNDTVRQAGKSKMMLHNCVSLIKEISQVFTLLPGDLVLTGTPKGVGPLTTGDKLALTLNNADATGSAMNSPLITVSTTVV